MSQILTQGEIDALLKGISGGEVETVQRDFYEGEEDVRPYDLASHNRIIRGSMPTLEILNEKFARLFRTTLSSLLRKMVNINTLSVQKVKYGEFMKTVPVPASMQIFKMNPLRGSALFIFESKIIFTLVDILFGGTGSEHYKVEGRDFTAVENNLIKRVVLSALSDLEKAWSSLIKLEVSYLRSEVNPQFVQIVVPSDLVIVIEFEVEIDLSSAVISICIPYSTIEPVREKLQAGYQSDRLEVDREWGSRFKEELVSSEVDITVELGRTELAGRDIINLKKGDVLILNKHVGDEIEAFVQGMLKFRGQPGLSKGNHAIQITGTTREKQG